MHRDFRKIMDRINDSNAQENIKKYSKLLTEVEKVSANSDQRDRDDDQLFLGVQDAEQGADHLSADPAPVLRRPGQQPRGVQ